MTLRLFFPFRVHMLALPQALQDHSRAVIMRTLILTFQKLHQNNDKNASAFLHLRPLHLSSITKLKAFALAA